MVLANKNMRAIDRLFDRMTSLSGMSSPLQLVDGWFDRLERDTRVACQPENGIYTVYEMTPVTYQIEVNGSGDIIHRRLSAEEVEVLNANKKVDENEG
jgi:hypothetical protein